MMEAILETLGLTKPAAAAQSDKNNNNNIHDEDDEEIANSWKEMFEDGKPTNGCELLPSLPRT